jgi:Sec-independent protein translocase protein TatA
VIPGLWELLLLGGLLVLLFGLGRVPGCARQLGRLHGLRQRLKNLLRFF